MFPVARPLVLAAFVASVDERADTVGEVAAEIVPRVAVSARDDDVAASTAAGAGGHNFNPAEDRPVTATIEEEPPPAAVEQDTSRPGRFISGGRSL